MAPLRSSLDLCVENELFRQLQSCGIACLNDGVNTQFLQRCQQRVADLLREKGERYFSLVQPWKDANAGPFAEMAHDPCFLTLLKNLARRGHSEAAVRRSELYNLLRVIAGPHPGKRAHRYHYDASVLTVLMPLLIPEGAPDQAGDLVAIPNHRSFRKYSLSNVIEKMLIQNPLARRLFQLRYARNPRHLVRLKPGNLYFFWGYRTLHGNLPSAPNLRRATLLFHFGDPHDGSFLTRSVLKLKWLRENFRGNTPRS